MNILVPTFHFHWHERFWTRPAVFDPCRFSNERRPAPDAMTYFPFGAGPRSCIGNHFALQELMIMAVLFYRHFQFRVQPGFVVEPDPLITLRPKHGLKMVLKHRKLGTGPTDSTKERSHEPVEANRANASASFLTNDP